MTGPSPKYTRVHPGRLLGSTLSYDGVSVVSRSNKTIETFTVVPSSHPSHLRKCIGVCTTKGVSLTKSVRVPLYVFPDPPLLGFTRTSFALRHSSEYHPLCNVDVSSYPSGTPCSPGGSHSFL